MKTWALVGAVLIGAGIIAGAVALKPSGFRECVTVISADIFARDVTVTLDPRDVEVEAARVCAGVVG